MLNRIFPKAFDNAYRGHRAALWLIWPILALHLAIDIGGFVTPDGGAQSADGIPLSSYPPAAAAAVLGVGAFLDVADTTFDLIGLLAAIRYRAMLPLIYLLIAAQYLAHKWVGVLHPIARLPSASGGSVTLAVFAVTLVGLALSVTGKEYSK